MTDYVSMKGNPEVHAFRRVTKHRFKARYPRHIAEISLYFIIGSVSWCASFPTKTSNWQHRRASSQRVHLGLESLRHNQRNREHQSFGRSHHHYTRQHKSTCWKPTAHRTVIELRENLVDFSLKIKGSFPTKFLFEFSSNGEKEAPSFKESLRIKLSLLWLRKMAYRAVLTFLIFTITREACGFLLPQHSSDRPSWPGLIRGGKCLKFHLPVNRNGLGMGLAKREPPCSHKYYRRISCIHMSLMHAFRSANSSRLRGSNRPLYSWY